VMAGAGFDASMIQEADGGLKDRLGRVAYVWTGSQEPAGEAFQREDRGGRGSLVCRCRQLHPGRQRRPPVRRHRGLRGCAPGRRTARDRRRQRGRRRGLGADVGADGGRPG
jgi:hypothetical protein